MKRTTLGLVLIAAALLSGCIIVPPRPYGRYQGTAHVTVVDSPRYGGGYDRGGRDDGPQQTPRRGW
ncbi:hypothetical protein [Roseateles sp.]|jgi:hypothetical protein|uniref:hypothetical protein n=1 Tax=Roseateles sp. TaxID=1971397 RepID=UPI003BAA6F8B